MSIKDAKIDDLLADIVDAPHKEPDVVDQWLQAADIYPGTARVPAKSLYTEFLNWHRQQASITESPPNIVWFGRALGHRLKRGRGKSGKFYYVSRKSTPQIPDQLKDQ